MSDDEEVVEVSMMAGGTELKVRWRRDDDIWLVKQMLRSLCESNITVVDGRVHIEPTGEAPCETSH